MGELREVAQLREVVRYDGIGADFGFIHTKERFIEIMEKEITNSEWRKIPEWLRDIRCDYKDEWVLPDDFVFFKFEDWIDYSGATVERIQSNLQEERIESHLVDPTP